MVSGIRTETLNSVMLTPIDASNGIIKPLLSERAPLQPMLLNEQKRRSSQVTVVMAVRQPACASCMEQAMQVATLARKNNEVSVVAVTKDSSNPLLLHFKRDYFADHPVYVDSDWKIYQALGNHRLSAWTVVKRAFPLLRRKISKKIKSPIFSQGDFWTKGGLLVFDRNGELIHVEQEEFGLELDLGQVNRVIEAAKHQANHQ